MKKLQIRGSGLLTVLLLIACLIVLGVAFGVAFSTTLNLSNLNASQLRSNLLARAAAQQAASTLQLTLPKHLVGSAPPGNSPTSALSYLSETNLLTSSNQIAGQAKILVSQSTDNLASSLPAQSTADVGTSQQSVPPFSANLVIQVQSDGQTSTYDAVVQQRWPYAVAGPGPIEVAGQFSMQGMPTPFPASGVTGSILAFSGGVLGHPVNNVFKVPPSTVPEITLSQIALFCKAQNSPINSPTLQIGGEFPCTLVTLSSTGAGVQAAFQYGVSAISGSSSVQGNADLASNAGAATSSIGAGSGISGPVSNMSDANFSALNVSSMFQFPDLSNWSALALPSGTTNVFITSGNSAPNGSTLVHGNPNGCVLNGDGTAPLILSSLGIENCNVGVQGDLLLNSNLFGGILSHASSVTTGLSGSGATLVVNGTLYVVGGDLSTTPGSSGMVIYCRQAFIGAGGHFNGLIVAENGLTVFSNLGGVGLLNIDGGLLVGGNAATVSYTSSQGQTTLLPLTGLTLAGCNITYDPQYMSYANQFGGLQVLSVTPR